MAKGVKIELGKIQETLLLPLWGRAVESQKKKPRLIDKVAIEIISTVDYDFSTITQNISWVSQFAWVARSLHVDNAILGFIKDYPKATIVNIGCGLDTTFDRIDNGQINFYDLDLPDVIDLRKKFFEENERRKTIACSFLDNRWFTQIQPDNGVFFIAAGVFYYFDENQIRDFFKSIAGGFRGSKVSLNCGMFLTIQKNIMDDVFSLSNKIFSSAMFFYSGKNIPLFKDTFLPIE